MDGSAALISILVGLVAVPLLQVFKRYTGLSGPAMRWLAFVISLFLGAIIVVSNGKVSWEELFTNPMLLLGSGGIVMSTATLIYGSIKDKMQLGG